VAILLVVGSHALSGVYPHHRPLLPFLSPGGWGGGFVGVQLFFVLSGFLITSMLKSELATTGRIGLLAFYKRRARRLVPALAVVCLLYALYAVLWLPASDRAGAWGAILRAATYTANLRPLLAHVPNSKWLSHTWSLAVEEQFYLGWAAVVVVLLPRGRRLALAAALGGVLITIVARHVVSAVRPAHDIMYYLLRWDALLIGCALALRPVRVPRSISWMAWLVMVGYSVFPPAQLRPLDYTLVSLASATVLLSAFEAKWLENRVLVWFGMVSYGLYLWHLLLMRTDQPTWLSLSASVAAAWLSYRLVELPILAAKRSGKRAVRGVSGLSGPPAESCRSQT